MVEDRTKDEYHLTPQGWVEGTYYYFRKTENEIEPPKDRVETWVRDMEQSSPFSKEVVTWSRVWRSKDYTEEEIKELKAKFPRPDY